MRKLVVILAILVAAGGAVWAYVTFMPPEAPREYMNVVLGDTKDEVRYKLGVPTHVVGGQIDDTKYKGFMYVYTVGVKDGPTAIPEGKGYETFDEWSYYRDERGDQYVSVAFNELGKARRVSCFDAITTGSAYCKPLLGIIIGDLEPDAVKRLGPPSQGKIDGITKTVVFEKLNLGLTFKQQKAYMLELADPVKMID